MHLSTLLQKACANKTAITMVSFAGARRKGEWMDEEDATAINQENNTSKTNTRNDDMRCLLYFLRSYSVRARFLFANY
jgi:hypothetical protein